MKFPVPVASDTPFLPRPVDRQLPVSHPRRPLVRVQPEQPHRAQLPLVPRRELVGLRALEDQEATVAIFMFGDRGGGEGRGGAEEQGAEEQESWKGHGSLRPRRPP